MEQDPYAWGDVGSAAEGTEPESVIDPVFDPRVAEDVQGLLYLGYLEETIQMFGHSFTMRTLEVGQELEIGLLIKEYTGTVTQGRALAAATVAASLEAVDGRTIYQQLGPNDKDSVRRKFDYVLKWFWPTIETLYNEHLRLQQRQIDSYEEFMSKSLGGQRESSPYADSSTDKES